MKLKAKIDKWNENLYSASIDLPHGSFEIDSSNYSTAKQAKRSAESLAARMGWKLIWEKK